MRTIQSSNNDLILRNGFLAFHCEHDWYVIGNLLHYVHSSTYLWSPASQKTRLHFLCAQLMIIKIALKISSRLSSVGFHAFECPFPYRIKPLCHVNFFLLSNWIGVRNLWCKRSSTSFHHFNCTLQSTWPKKCNFRFWAIAAWMLCWLFN